MSELLRQASWIWSNNNPQADEYGEFVDHFMFESGKVILQISADSNYAAYINGELAAWGQYADFPYDKVYDEVDVTTFCKKGKNRLAIIVWYYGTSDSFTYYPGYAGLLYALSCDDNLLCKSDIDTVSRKSNAYQNHRQKYITVMIGYGYGYDMTKEDDWLVGELVGFSPSVVVEQDLPLRKRPCNKLSLLPEVVGKECKRITDTDLIFDLGGEQVGFLSFDIISDYEQEITIGYGEHLVDGCVRQKIDGRDFSISYYAKIGENTFLNPFRRLGCRYLEIHSQYPITIHKMAIAPTMYILEEAEAPVMSQNQKRIYDMSVTTLRLCMHEHYEDCPWREQSLYAMDSRNQMLCGYYVFEEYQFPKANLQLIAMDRREDDLLSICYPMKADLVIPSFSLGYVFACKEYLEHSQDVAFLKAIYPKLASVIEAFTSRLQNGIIFPFEGSNYWNFYEWTEGLDGNGPYNNETFDTQTPDLVLNTMLSLALQNIAFIADELGIEHKYNQISLVLNQRIYELFWNEEEGVFYHTPKNTECNELGNSLAILCGAVTGVEADGLCERLCKPSDMTPLTLSMQCFKYDALLKVNREKYASFVLMDIENNYEPMLAFGGNTVWETAKGESDFDNAGSLCHGWSAMPIYYYHILLK